MDHKGPHGHTHSEAADTGANGANKAVHTHPHTTPGAGGENAHGAHEAAHSHTHGAAHSHTHTHTKAVLNRMSRAIGHLTAVRGMVEDGRDCAEVLIQLSAVRSAINGVCEIILKDHIEHCIVDAINDGDMSTLEALDRAIGFLVK